MIPHLPFAVTKIDHVFDSMLDFHASYLERMKASTHYKSLSPAVRAREFATVRLGFGRQIGKSSYIARSAMAGDIILCRTHFDAEKMSDRSASFRFSHDNKTDSWQSRKEVEGAFQNVWVDDASIMSKEDLDSMYERFAEKCTRFILIG